MKTLRYISILCLLLVAASFNSCKDDDEKVVSGITGQSWQEGKALEITFGKELSVSFNANDDWTATTNSDWCNILDKSGKSGRSTLRILVATTATKPRTAFITIKVKGYDSTSFQVTQNETGGITTENMEINVWVDQYLREMYLWNDEYNTLKLDFAKSYERFFYDVLGSMTTNTLDKRLTEDNNYYTLFSYIEKRIPISPTRATKLVDKELAYSFGITGITPVSIGTPNDYTIYLCIQGVYPDSPAAIAGIKRGSMIKLVNGNKITDNNLTDYYYSLLSPNAAFGLTLTADIIKGGAIVGSQEVALTSKAMYCNPVIHTQVTEINGHRVGYLVYSGFEASFDQELFDAFKEFKNKNVTDLILDLRYNGGGHTISANLITTCIAGEASQGKVFNSLRYNKERMEKLDNKREEELFAYNNYYNLGSSLSAGALGFTRVYCLVGERTASASELVINSLRGIDVDVILIGEKTVGKNVGMEYTDFTVRGNIYRVVPITFQSYNAKGEGDYEKGFVPEPNLIIDETNPYNEIGRFFIYKQYGANEEPLYAKAIELITGKSSSLATRSIQATIKGSARKMPVLFRPGHDGMLKKYEPAE